MDEKIVIPIITLIAGLISGYLLTFISDKRKYSNEHKRELRTAYARWFALQRAALRQLKLLLEEVANHSAELKQLINVQDELKEFQSTLATLQLTIAEVSLLEKLPKRLKYIRSLDITLDKTYQALLDTLQTQKLVFETRKENDEKLSLLKKEKK